MDIYATRHPIFDQTRHVVAYELVFRQGLLMGVGGRTVDRDERRMLDSALQGFGLDRLAGNRPAVLRASAEFLHQGHWGAIPGERVILRVRPDPTGQISPTDLERAITAARASGHRIALSADTADGADLIPLPLADFVFVDYSSASADRRAALAKAYGRTGKVLVAEKVVTHDQFREATTLGYHQFQGYFFCEAEVFTGGDIAASGATLAQLIAEVNRSDLDLDKLEELIKRDLALSVRLLRYLQSAGLGWRHQVTSIGQGLRVLGHRAVRKWASLTAYTLIASDKPSELVTTSLVRAQMCEELGARKLGDAMRSELFLVGLLSTLEPLLDRPIEVLLADMPLAREVSDTLLGIRTPMSDFLDLTMAYERGEWARVDGLLESLGIEPTALGEAYGRTLTWVDQLAAA
jgi:EAL and modified HD-GYP domain-containing signal transduction protein